MPFTVVEIQQTPNPNALKFIVAGTLSAQPVSFFNAAAAAGHPLAAQLFAIEGVSSVLLLNDFLTINKTPQAKWQPIKRAVQRALSRT